MADSNKHILVAEDERMVAKLYDRLLRNAGFEVTLASNGLEALTVFRENPAQFDLLITDQVMPEMKGAELIRKVHEVVADFPCILCSGYAAEIDEAGLGNLNIVAYLQKPIEFDALLRVVGDCLGYN